MNPPLLFNIENELTNADRIFTSMSDEVELAVHENSRYRWLTMDNTVQSVMELSVPHKPLFPHMHSMLLSLYLHNRPQRILELGLGGGALRRFFKQHFPCATTLTYELNQDVIAIYRRYFCIDSSASSDRHIIAADARQAVPAPQPQDMIFVDLFTGNQPPTFLNTPDFYGDCQASLTSQGVLIINLLPVATLQTIHIELILTDLFGHKPSIFAVPRYRNRILMISKTAAPAIKFDAMLHQLCHKYALDLLNIVQLK